MGRPVSSGCKKTTEVSLRGRYKGDIGLGGSSTPQEEPLWFFHDFHIGRMTFHGGGCAMKVILYFEACNTTTYHVVSYTFYGTHWSHFCYSKQYLRCLAVNRWYWSIVRKWDLAVKYALSSLCSILSSQFFSDSDTYLGDHIFVSTFLLIRVLSLTSRCPYRA